MIETRLVSTRRGNGSVGNGRRAQHTHLLGVDVDVPQRALPSLSIPTPHRFVSVLARRSTTIPPHAVHLSVCRYRFFRTSSGSMLLRVGSTAQPSPTSGQLISRPETPLPTWCSASLVPVWSKATMTPLS
eukprot:2325920-Rhodomonas_salina.3